MSHDALFREGEDLRAPSLASPRFCPGCSRTAGPGDVLCPHCGERLADQGFCPVCERAWRLGVGTPCPKHEIPLEDAPPAPAPPFPVKGAAGGKLETVAVFTDALQVEAPRIRLEAEGIPTFVEGARMGSPSMYHVATGGVRLQVPQALAADARVVLDQSWAPPVDDDDLDDAWEDLAPAPGDTRRSVMRGAIVLILFGPLILALVSRLLGR